MPLRRWANILTTAKVDAKVDKTNSSMQGMVGHGRALQAFVGMSGFTTFNKMPALCHCIVSEEISWSEMQDDDGICLQEKTKGPKICKVTGN